jgi:putative phosphoesterase
MPTVVGVISDTHGLLRPEALAALRGSDVIVHAGDIGSEAILHALREVAPVIAVRGNNDRDAWAADLPEAIATEIAGKRIYVIHDVKQFRGDAVAEPVDVLIAGHSHRPLIERRGPLLFVNPGSAGPRRFTLPIAVARLYIAANGVRAEIVPLPESRPAKRLTSAARAPLRTAARTSGTYGNPAARGRGSRRRSR